MKNLLKSFKIFLRKKIVKLLPICVNEWYYKHIKMPYYFKKNLLIRTTDRDLFFSKVNTVKTEELGKKYWTKQTKWQSQDNITLKRYTKMQKFIQTFFVPHLKKDYFIADLACAAGDLTFLVADKVQQIDAFELSAGMVALATQQAQERKITNINFQQADATTVELPKEKYDAFMMLGLLTCLEDESAEKIVKKVFAAMKPQAKLLVRDGITLLKEKEYSYNTMTGFLTFYRTEDYYIKLFNNNGFKLIDKTTIESKGVLGLLLEKQ